MRSECDLRPESVQAGRKNTRLGPLFNTVHPEVSLHVRLCDVIVHGSCESSGFRGCMLNTFTEVTIRRVKKIKKEVLILLDFNDN